MPGRLCVAAAGAQPIVITDIDEGRLKFAQDLVARAKPYKVERGKTPQQCGEEIAALAGMRVTLAMECTGVESSIAAACFAVKFGGKVFVTGVGGDEIKIPFGRINTQEIDLQFQYRYANQWPRAIRLLQSGVIDLTKLVTHRFKIEDAKEAFSTAADPKTGAIKVQITSE